jgi:predicted DsbA family dithiol-disulfide isomerase
MSDLVRYATEAGIDPARFRDRLASRAGAARVAEDVDSADLSGVSGTPTFFINGSRHFGSYDIGALTAAVQAAKAASLASQPPSRSAARSLSRDLPRAFDRLLVVRREAWSAIV